MGFPIRILSDQRVPPLVFFKKITFYKLLKNELKIVFYDVGTPKGMEFRNLVLDFDEKMGFS